MMALSPAEALGTYNGFAVAGILQDMLVWIPRLILFYVMVRTAYEFREGAESAQKSLVRLAVSIGVLAIFWPGAVLSGGGQAVNPSQFVSAAARADGAPIQTAAQVGGQIVASGEVGLIPLKLIEFMSEGWLHAALAVRQEALKPFSATLPLQWLFRHGLEAESVAAIRDWSEKCVLPAQRRVLENGSVAPTFQSMQPFPGTPVGEAMQFIHVVPGRLSGWLSWINPFADAAPVTCLHYTNRILARVQAQLSQTSTPSGKPITSVWAQELGVDASTATQVLVMREVLGTIQVAPAPSLRGYFGVGGGLQALIGGVRGFLAGGGKGIAVGAGGAVASNQLTAAADAVLGLVGPALLVTEFAPDLLGMAMTVMLGAMPILLCYVLVPGRQAIVTPVMAYFVVLALLYSSPFWWAVIELTSTTAAENKAALMDAPMAWARAWVSGLLYATLGIGIVVVGLGTVMSMAAGVSGLSIVRSIRRA